MDTVGTFGNDPKGTRMVCCGAMWPKIVTQMLLSFWGFVLFLPAHFRYSCKFWQMNIWFRNKQQSLCLGTWRYHISSFYHLPGEHSLAYLNQTCTLQMNWKAHANVAASQKCFSCAGACMTHSTHAHRLSWKSPVSKSLHSSKVVALHAFLLVCSKYVLKMTQISQSDFPRACQYHSSNHLLQNGKTINDHINAGVRVRGQYVWVSGVSVCYSKDIIGCRSEPKFQ